MHRFATSQLNSPTSCLYSKSFPGAHAGPPTVYETKAIGVSHVIGNHVPAAVLKRQGLAGINGDLLFHISWKSILELLQCCFSHMTTLYDKTSN